MAPHLGHLSHIVAFHGNHDDRIKELRYLGGDPSCVQFLKIDNNIFFGILFQKGEASFIKDPGART